MNNATFSVWLGLSIKTDLFRVRKTKLFFYTHSMTATCLHVSFFLLSDKSKIPPYLLNQPDIMTEHGIAMLVHNKKKKCSFRIKT